MTSEFVQRHKAGLLVSVYALFSIFCLVNRVDPYIQGIKTVAWFLISPEVVYTGKFFNRLDSLQGRVFRLARAEGENVILREQNIQLSKKELERDALESENQRLRSLVELRLTSFPAAIVAQVVERHVQDWFYSLIINKGAPQGIRLSSAVVAKSNSGLALVGRIAEINEGTSKVMLMTDPVSFISVSIPASGDVGLLNGENGPKVRVKYLGHQSLVKAGDEILTLGLGGVFPPGIPIGRVTTVSQAPDGFFKEAEVQPYLDFGSVVEVMILERRELTAEAVPTP